MALVDNAWYVNFGDGATTGYYAVTAWATGTVIAAGALRRQLAAPAVGSERVFVCVVAGTTHASTEPTWVITRGGKTTDNTVTWQECTGIAALNGDATNTPSWTITATPPGGVKNTAVTLGQVIKRDAGTSYQICTTAGTAGNGAEPAFSNTAGTTTSDNTVTWTSLGVVGNFTGWQAPHARLGNSFTATWGQAGNKFFVASEHAETQASALTINSPGTGTNPTFTYCVNRAGSIPPVSADLSTTATITTTGNSTLSINSINGHCYGIIFSCGSGANAPQFNVNASASGFGLYKNCAFRSGGTNSSVILLGNNSAQRLELVDCTLQFGATGSSVQFGVGYFKWSGSGSSITGATLPTTLVSAYNSAAEIIFSGIDLSALGSGATLFGNQLSDGNVRLLDCKLGASVTVAAALTTLGSPRVDIISSDSAATNYRHERYRFEGVQTVETTIVRTGGASDGTTTISQKVITSTASKWIIPFDSFPIAISNDSTSAITTLTIYGTTTGGGVPNNDDIWVEVEYLGSALTPAASFITTTKTDNLAASAATNNSSDASTWGGGGAGNGFKIVVPSFTPGMKGPINITVKVAKASTTYYIDPRPSISGVTVSKSEILAPGVYANEISSGTGGGISRARGFGGFS